MGTAEAAFCRWKKVHVGMGVSEIRRLKQLAESCMRYGYRRLQIQAQREVWHGNHKRLYHLGCNLAAL